MCCCAFFLQGEQQKEGARAEPVGGTALVTAGRRMGKGLRAPGSFLLLTSQ